MEKIIFEDLPSTNTPLNAENLNKIQDNIEDAIQELINKEIVLYENATGSNGTITLSDSIENYKYVEIEFRYWENYLPLFRFYNSSGKPFCFSAQVDDSNFIRGKFNINDTTLTREITRLTSISNGVVSSIDEGNIYITRVVGYQ